MAAFVMERADYTYPMARAAARELLATCVLKQIVCLFTPYNLNKVLPASSYSWQLCLITPYSGVPVHPLQPRQGVACLIIRLAAVPVRSLQPEQGAACLIVTAASCACAPPTT